LCEKKNSSFLKTKKKLKNGWFLRFKNIWIIIIKQIKLRIKLNYYKLKNKKLSGYNILIKFDLIINQQNWI